jgi:hypothetical protein
MERGHLGYQDINGRLILELKNIKKITIIILLVVVSLCELNYNLEDEAIKKHIPWLHHNS